MSGGAIAGAAVMGAGASIYSSNKASSSANAATAAQASASEAQNQASLAQLAFQQQQYEDWKGIFGDVQDTLKTYYNNLNANTVTSLGLQSIEQEHVRSRTALDTAMAQRGITNSGVNAQALTNLESTRMLGRANVRAGAEQTTMAQKLGFLQTGLGQQSSLQSGISNAYSNQMNVLGQQATTSAQQASAYNNQANQAMMGVGSSIGSGINTYMMYNALNSNNTANTMNAGSVASTPWWVG